MASLNSIGHLDQKDLICLSGNFLFVQNFFSILLFRWATLKDALVERRSKLGESQSLQSVSRDVDDIEGWISEKLQTALDESYKDPSNTQVSFILDVVFRISFS